MLTASQLAVESLRVTPVARAVAETDTACCLCGVAIKAGESTGGKAYAGKDAFMDEHFMANRGGEHACRYCATVFDAKLMKRVKAPNAKGVMSGATSLLFTRDGAYNLATDGARKWFFQNLPKPPFVVVCSPEATFRHMIWKTPVTLDRNLVEVGTPRQVYHVNYPKLLEAVRCCSEVAKAMSEARGKKGSKNSLRHPYVFLDRKGQSLTHGMLRAEALTLARENPAVGKCIDFLRTLGTGELWALAALMGDKEAVQPEKVRLT